MIALIRVDDRLIHGQVVEGWLKVIDADHIMVANDEAAADEMQRTLFAMALPPHVRLSVLAISQAAETLQNGVEPERTLVLLANLKDALRLLDAGFFMESLNLGGLHYAEGKKQILRSVSLSQEDIETLRKISERGVRVECRALPHDSRVDIFEHIHDEK